MVTKKIYISNEEPNLPEPQVALPPPENYDGWKSPTIIINGNVLSTEDYTKKKDYYNSLPINVKYFNNVVSTLNACPHHPVSILSSTNKKEKTQNE